MMIDTLRLLVIEDEHSIQEFLVQELRKVEFVEVVGSAAQIQEAFHLIISSKPDAIFLDIKIIGGDAFQLLDRLSQARFPIPPVIICTGFPEYAIQTLNQYRQYVIRYLTKPLDINWESKIMSIIDELQINKKNPSLLISTEHNIQESFYVMSEGKYLRIELDQVLWLEAAGNGYIYIVTQTKDIKVEYTLSSFKDRLSSFFCQISRTHIVNTNFIHSIDRNEREVIIIRQDKSKHLGIGDVYYQGLLKILGIKK